MQWFKADTAGILRGSIRFTMTPEQRSVWFDLLALASDSRLNDGTLRVAEGIPMDRDRIAEQLIISRDLLDSVINICCEDRNRDDNGYRMKVWDDGTIEICNWTKYQAVPEQHKRSKDPRTIELQKRAWLRRLQAELPAEAVDEFAERMARNQGCTKDEMLGRINGLSVEKQIEMYGKRGDNRQVTASAAQI